MKLFEYQVKEIFREYQIPTPGGVAVLEPNSEAVLAASEQVTYPVVLKSQVLTGGRGKAGGIQFAENEMICLEKAKQLFELQIKGYPVKKLLVEPKLQIEKEIYVGILIDRSKQAPTILLSAEGGVEIEELAKTEPWKIKTLVVNPLKGIRYDEALTLCKKAGISGKFLGKIADIITKLYKIFENEQAELVEINPLVITRDGKVLAADGRMVTDDNSSWDRYINDEDTLTDLERQAKSNQLTYVELPGDICVLANGAGLTMTTMDVITEYGGNPANFMEVGGGAYTKAETAIGIALSHPNLTALLVNIFGAFARTDVIVDGVTQAIAALKPDLPIVFRVRGTGELEAREMVRTRLGIEPFTDLDEAVKEVISLANARKEREWSRC